MYIVVKFDALSRDDAVIQFSQRNNCYKVNAIKTNEFQTLKKAKFSLQCLVYNRLH
jgi:hypothetical protein